MKTKHRRIPSSTRVRYIKLGEGGRWESLCLKDGTIRFGFGSGHKDRFSMSSEGRWEELTASFLREGKTKGTATRFTNETKLFFEDAGDTLWITFIGETLFWGMLSPEPAKREPHGDSVTRQLDGGWKSTDANGEPLTKDRLSGALGKLAAYRGTSCKVDVDQYAIRRINGEKIPEVETALATLKDMKIAVLGLMRLLGDRDFEMLVDLVFSTSGWQRQGAIGRTQKTLDLDLLLPITDQRAFVQVKSKTNSKQLAEYVARIDGAGPYDRMFYVYHSGNAQTDDDRVTVIDPFKLAELVLDAGLTSWLIRKVS